MKPIAESELIINSRGAIYHLNLRPEEIAGTIITVGDPDRVKEVSRYFDSIEIKIQNRECVTHTGYLGKKRISVVSTGMGTDNIDVVLNELDALVNIDFSSRTIKEKLNVLNIIRIGSCGALQENLSVNSFVASTHGLGIDNLLNYYRFDQNEEEKQLLHSFVTYTQLHGQVAFPYISSASASLLKNFVNGFYHGITVTCPGFYGPQGRVLRLGVRNPDLISRLIDFRFGPYLIANFEMETSGIYGIGKLLGHHCLSLSVIVANRVTKDFTKDSKVAIQKLAIKTLEIISDHIQ